MAGKIARLGIAQSRQGDMGHELSPIGRQPQFLQNPFMAGLQLRERARGRDPGIKRSAACSAETPRGDKVNSKGSA